MQVIEAEYRGFDVAGSDAMTRTKFRAPVLVNVAILLIAALLFAAGYYFLSDEGLWLGIFFVAFGVLGLVAFLDSITSYIGLEEDALHLRSRFTDQCISRCDIERVTWEKGVGVSVKLQDGSWVKMPELFENSLSLSNSIRAWLGKNHK